MFDSQLGQTGKILLLIIIFTVIYWLYDQTYRARYGNSSMDSFLSVPPEIKCFFGEDKCEEGDIDYWTLLHGIVYLIIGILVPNQYLTVVIISIVFELFQPYLGNGSRYLINPLVNLTGYSIGSIINKSFQSNSQSKCYDAKYSIYVH